MFFSTTRGEYWSYDQTVGGEKSPNKFLQAPNVGLHVWWTCGQHALTKSEKIVNETLIFTRKINVFSAFFRFYM